MIYLDLTVSEKQDCEHCCDCVRTKHDNTTKDLSITCFSNTLNWQIGCCVQGGHVSEDRQC